MVEQSEQRKQWARIVAKAWADEEYKQRLLDDPTAVMKEEGVEVPQGVDIKCVEATESQTWLVLPPRPNGATNILEERLSATDYCGVACGYTVPSI